MPAKVRAEVSRLVGGNRNGLRSAEAVGHTSLHVASSASPRGQDHPHRGLGPVRLEHPRAAILLERQGFALVAAEYVGKV